MIENNNIPADPQQQHTGVTTNATEAAAAQDNADDSLENRGEKRKAGDDPTEEGGGVDDDEDDATKKKKRLCRYPGCPRVIKSQGHCQRHGAKAKRCKVEGCEKQAQGTHDGMCKRHWKAANFPDEASRKGATPPEPEGDSVYDSILPMSIAYRPLQQQQKQPAEDPNQSKDGAKDLLDPPAAPDGFQVMPLVAHLKEGTLAGKPAGWHRNAERRARGMFPVKGLSVQLEPWERQLALVEIMLLSGGTPYANFKELAFAWGREKGFHHVLANSVCERRGEVERKKRSDAGKSMTPEERQTFRSKLQKARDKNGTSRKAKKAIFFEEGGEEEEEEEDEAGLKASVEGGEVSLRITGTLGEEETGDNADNRKNRASGGEAPADHIIGGSGEAMATDAHANAGDSGEHPADPLMGAPHESTGNHAKNSSNNTNNSPGANGHEEEEDAMDPAAMAVDLVLT